MITERARRPIIGLSANVLGEDPDREIYGGRPLLYLEQSMGTWLMRAGARPYLVPFAPEGADVETSLAELAAGLDGLVLEGGSDIAARTYGAEPLEEEPVDDARDRYEWELVEACLELDIPILGICRGMQMINVIQGGTLIQDIDTQVEGADSHRDRDRFDQHTHRVVFEPGGRLESLYDAPGGRIVSVHHQGIAELGDGLVVEARSEEDDLIEALRSTSEKRYVLGVQWHPEFQDPSDGSLLDPDPLVEDFLAAVRKRLEPQSDDRDR